MSIFVVNGNFRYFKNPINNTIRDDLDVNTITHNYFIVMHARCACTQYTGVMSKKPGTTSNETSERIPKCSITGGRVMGVELRDLGIRAIRTHIFEMLK